MYTVLKTKHRNLLRKKLGKNYYILKRKLKWTLRTEIFAKKRSADRLPYQYVQHKSFLLRPLKDVDMQLQYNKITNLKLAIVPINGIVLQPGDVFSVWKLIGKPSRSRGYLEGLILQDGRIKKGTGGGLCQLGNLIYWMALHTPLTIQERYRHSYDVFPDINRTIPFACGATLSYNYIDLQLKNETSSSFQINLWLDNDYLNGSVCSNAPQQEKYEIFETDHCIKMQWWGAYTRHNRIWKRVYDLNNVVKSEMLVSENHAIMMYNPLLEVKNEQGVFSNQQIIKSTNK